MPAASLSCPLRSQTFLLTPSGARRIDASGFLYEQYADKWAPTSWRADKKWALRNIFLFRIALVATHVILISLIAAPSILMPDGARSFPVTEHAPDLATMAGWVTLELIFAVFVSLLELWEIVFSLLPDEDEDADSAWLMTSRVKQAWRKMCERGGQVLLLSTCASVASCSALLMEDASAAREHGWVRMCLAVGSSIAWIVLLTEGCILFRELNLFVNVVFNALVTDVVQFLAVFTPILIGFTTGINALMQLQPTWATRWGSWWLTLENLLLLSLSQEPPMVFDDSPSPSSIVGLLGDFSVHGSDSVLPTLLYYALFVLYLIVSVVLLINLLIAMMSARFEKKKTQADLDTRVAFCRLVLRFERIVELTNRFFSPTGCTNGVQPKTALGKADGAFAASSQKSLRSNTSGDSLGAPRSSLRANRKSRPLSSSSRSAPSSQRSDAAPSTLEAQSSSGAAARQMRYITFRQKARKGGGHLGLQQKASNIFDEGIAEDDVAGAMRDLSRRFEQLEKAVGSGAAHGGGMLVGSGGGSGAGTRGHELWHKLAADRAAEAAEKAALAREAHTEQTNAFQRVVHQLMKSRSASGSAGADFEAQMEVADAAAEKARSALIAAGERAAEAAQAASAVTCRMHVDEAGGPAQGPPSAPATASDPSTLAFERLRVLTASLGPEGFPRHLARAISARAAQRGEAPRGTRGHFASHVDWPASHPPFASHAWWAAPPEAAKGGGVRCEPASELRALLAEVFSLASGEIAQMPEELIRTLAEALDRRSDGLIDEKALCGSWLAWFAARRGGGGGARQPERLASITDASSTLYSTHV